MSKEILVGATDQTIDVFIQANNVTTGAGLTGLVFNTASLTCYYRKGATGSATALTLATQTVGGAHSDGGFVEIDATNMPGMYRLDLSDTMVAAAGLLKIMLKGAANMAACVIEIEIVAVNKYDAVRYGLSAIPNAAAAAVGGLLTAPTTANTGLADVTRLLGTAWLTPQTAGTPDVNVVQWNELATVDLPLAPTTAGRKLDVSVGGEAGLDWANVGSPTTVLNLSGTSIKTATDVEAATTTLTVRLSNARAGYLDNLNVAGAIALSSEVNDVYTLVGGLITTVGVAGAGLTAINLPDQTMNIIGNITGNLSGSVGSVTGAVGSVVGLTASNLDATISSRASAASIAALNNVSTAQVQASAEAALAVTIPDSIPADGTRPSVQSGIYMIAQMLTEFAIVGVTYTVKKPDGTTTLFTLTLNDATNPTALTRAT